MQHTPQPQVMKTPVQSCPKVQGLHYSRAPGCPTYHVSADRLGDHTSDRGLDAGGSHKVGAWRGQHSRGGGCLGQQGQRQRCRGDMHGHGGGHRYWWGCLGPVEGRSRLSLGSWDHFADDAGRQREEESEGPDLVTYTKPLPSLLWHLGPHGCGVGVLRADTWLSA